LNPIKKKVLIERTAEQLNLAPGLVSDVVGFFFKYVQNKLSNVEHVRVLVPNLGTFEVQKKRMVSKLEKSKNYLAKTENEESPSMSVFYNRTQFKKDVEKYEKLLEKIKEEELEKIKQKQNKNK
jgi:nucleoid DNA-binding protein